MSVSIISHGHSTYTIVVGDTRLLIDPFFGDNPMATIGADEVDADYILLTHGHADHTADALSVAERSGATVISNYEIVGWVNAKGHPNAHAQHIGGGFQHPFGHVKMTPAWHGSVLPDGAYGGNPAGFLLTVEGKKIYVSGDTGLFSDMTLIGKRGWMWLLFALAIILRWGRMIPFGRCSSCSPRWPSLATIIPGR